MRVLCIDSSNPKTPHLLKPEHWIYEGETYTVSSSYLDKTDGHEYYYLQERTDIPKPGYRANRFVPLSQIDEYSTNHYDHQRSLLSYSTDHQAVVESTP